MSHQSQLGQGKIGCTFWALLVVVAGLIAWKTIPVKIASAELEDYIAEQAQFAGYSNERQIQQAIHGKAVELDLPLKESNIQVRKLPHDEVNIKATYTVPLKFPFYTHHWDFEIEVTRPTFKF